MISDSLTMRLQKLHIEDIDHRLKQLSDDSVQNVRQILSGVIDDFNAMVLKIMVCNEAEKNAHLLLDYPKMSADISDIESDFYYLCDTIRFWLDEVDDKYRNNIHKPKK